MIRTTDNPRHRRAALVGGVVLLGALAAGTAAGSQTPLTPPAVTGGSLILGQDRVEWSGTNCADMHLRITLHVPDPSIEKSLVVGTAADATCAQLPETVVTSQVPAAVAPAPMSVGDPTLPASTDPCGPFGNVIHTTHTLQDAPRIDIAWFRTSSDRIWNCAKTWFHKEIDEYSRVKAWADGGPSWWIVKELPSFPHVSWHCPFGGACTTATAHSSVQFHTDFLHCNAINQDIRLETRTISKADGTYDVQFDKFGSCPGVFSATGTKTNTNNNRTTGGFGGSGTCIVAIPNEQQTTPSASGPCFTFYEAG